MPKPFIAWIIFKGLPSSFDSLASRKYEDISGSLTNIDISKLISELISEEARMNSNLEANKVYKGNNNTKPFCKHCNKSGHLETRCYTKYPELKNNSNSNSNSKNSNKSNRSNKKNKNKSNSDNSNSKESNKTLMLASTNKRTITNKNNSISYSISNFYTNSNNTIILDSGATEHFTPNKDWLLDYKPVNNRYITIANGTKLPLLGIGNIPILTSNNREILVTEVNYIPDLKTTLLSTRTLTNKGWNIEFNSKNAKIVNKDITILAKWDSNAYFIDISVDYTKLEKLVYKVDTSLKNLNIDLLYKRLNHLNKDYLIKTIDNSIGYRLDKTSKTELDNCDSYKLGKITKNVSYKQLDDNKDILSYFDIDIAGPFRILGLLGEKYFITFTCRKTRAVYIYTIKHKSEAVDKLIELYKLLENQLNISIKGTHSDNALEFKSNKWTSFCKDKGIYNDYSSPYSPEQMGIAERLNRYILERLITICAEKNIPLFLWPYIVRSIVNIKNRTYNSTTTTIPYISIFNTKPDISSIKVLGSLCYSLIPKEIRNKQELGKLANKANIGILVGWESSNNYLVYIPKLQKVISTRDVIIKEDLVYRDDYIIDNNID